MGTAPMLYFGKRRLEAASLCVAVMDFELLHVDRLSKDLLVALEDDPGRRRELNIGAVHLAFGQTSASISRKLP